MARQEQDRLRHSEFELVSERIALTARVAARYKAGAQDQIAVDAFLTLLGRANIELKKWRSWAKGFSSALREAQKSTGGLPKGYLWQAPFVDFWKPFDPIERRLVDLAKDLEGMSLDNTQLGKSAGKAAQLVYPSRGARIEDAIRGFKFFPNPTTGQEEIAYPATDLESWHKAFMSWVESSIRQTESIERRLRKKLQ